MKPMILAFWRALFQATATGLGTFALIAGAELALTNRLPDMTLLLTASLSVTTLVFLVRLTTLRKQQNPH